MNTHSNPITKKQHPEVNGGRSGDNGTTPFIAQQQQDEEADLEDESLPDSEHRNNNNDEEDEEEDGLLDTTSSLGGSMEHVPPSKPFTKHPLQHRWTLWYDNPGKKTTSNSWGDFLQKITSFDTVEDFWRVFNNIKPASSLVTGSNYHLFKENIEPKWEDVQNSRGGRWTVSVPLKTKNMLDTLWLYAVLACIGETFECTEDVCGVVVSARRAQDRLSLWTKDSKNEQNVLLLGRQLKQFLELPDSEKLGYQSHEESAKPVSRARNRYEV